MDYRVRQKRNSKVIGTVLCAILIVIAFSIYFISQKNQTSDTTQIVDPIEGQDDKAVMGILKGDEWKVNSNDPYKFNYRLNNSMHFERADSLGNIMIENHSTNTNHMGVELVINDDRVIYRSGIIPAGFCISSDLLDVKLEDGEYQGTMIISIMEPETMEVLHTVEEFVTINIGRNK